MMHKCNNDCTKLGCSKLMSVPPSDKPFGLYRAQHSSNNGRSTNYHNIYSTSKEKAMTNVGKRGIQNNLDIGIDTSRSKISSTNTKRFLKGNRSERRINYPFKNSKKTPANKLYDVNKSNFKSSENLRNSLFTHIKKKYPGSRIKENYTNQSQHQFSLKWFRKRIEKVEESNKKYQEKQNINNDIPESNSLLQTNEKQSNKAKYMTKNENFSNSKISIMKELKVPNNLVSQQKQDDVDHNLGPCRKTISNKLESKKDYKSHEDLHNYASMNKRTQSQNRDLKNNKISTKENPVFKRLYNEIEVRKNMRDRSLKCLYHTNLEREINSKEEQKESSKSRSSMKKHSKSSNKFYNKMQKFEERKSKRMLQLHIDREKKEISEIKQGKFCKKRTNSNSSGQAKSEQNASVHNKLFDDSRVRDLKMKEIKKKHMLDDLLSMSNDNDKREKFFVPIINKSSRRLASKNRQSKSSSINENLYDDAIERKKSSELLERTKIEELKQKINQSMKSNMLFRSKKILYKNFKQKYDDVLSKLEIENSDEAKIEYDHYLVILKHIVFYDQHEESKISENKEVFDGWRAMMGDMNGYVTKLSLRDFLCDALNLKNTESKCNIKNDTSSLNESNVQNKNKEIDTSKIQISKIDLLQVEEKEVRLESVKENSDSLQSIQKLYREIKGHVNINLPVKKNIKNFFNLKLKENQLKSSKQNKIKDEQNISLNKSGITSQTLGNMIYNNLKQEIILNKTKSDDPNLSLESSK